MRVLVLNSYEGWASFTYHTRNETFPFFYQQVVGEDKICSRLTARLGQLEAPTKSGAVLLGKHRKSEEPAAITTAVCGCARVVRKKERSFSALRRRSESRGECDVPKRACRSANPHPDNFSLRAQNRPRARKKKTHIYTSSPCCSGHQSRRR